ncbi:DUF6355 family natural product biosynthesis protein [Lentzea aerocolonigenes]|uniref:DUF6355 family natural product biosynthesis protein n=1 Tax=Lentzea aerocolonigenes TaxID=68170 RepID=UPI000B16F422|nr:DUF6355 family natural product biosynthesis protein [Lentzea aerocolonigenes]MCP2243328.1 hypothetical protein [Lentzea aerocolonigenes]
MKANFARALSAAGMLLAATAVGTVDTSDDASASVMPRYCGFYEISPPRGELTGYYYHCGDNFILIKFHWDQGSTGTSCVPPWGQTPFFKDGQYKVVNAYYVTTPPNLTGPPGNQWCSIGQPRA